MSLSLIDPTNGQSPLHVAATTNLESIVTLLLENGAINSIQDKQVYTNLLYFILFYMLITCLYHLIMNIYVFLYTTPKLILSFIIITF